jgi:hypothetical protein
MEIKGEDYVITYDPDTVTAVFRGALRLRGVAEYAPIVELLDGIIAATPETATVDLRGLRFLNSSGINVLFRFVIQMREQGITHLIVLGSSLVPWQGKSLKNLQRLMPALQLEME